MFIKLLKHNLKPIFRSILPFAIAFFASIILFNLTDYQVEYVYDGQHAVVDVAVPQLLSFLHGLFNFCVSCSLILLCAVTIRAIWYRFKTSFYSDEAYLTHTLPVSRRTLWNAQICTIFIVLLSLILFIIFNCLILLLSKDGQNLLESLGLLGGCSHCVGEYYYIEARDLSFYLSYILTVLTEFSFLTLCGISGIILGHRFNKNLSIIFGVGLYLIGSFLLVGIFFFLSTFDQGILDLFQGLPTPTPGLSVDLSFMPRALSYISLVYLLYGLILYLIDQKLLQHGINLD